MGAEYNNRFKYMTFLIVIGSSFFFSEIMYERPTSES